MKAFARKYMVEILCLLTFLYLFCLIAPRAFADFDEDSDLKTIMAKEISIAYAQCNHAIDENFTDMGCQIAEEKLRDKIDSILFFYRDEIMETIVNQDLEEYHLEERQNLVERDEDEILDRYGVSMDLKQFND